MIPVCCANFIALKKKRKIKEKAKKKRKKRRRKAMKEIADKKKVKKENTFRNKRKKRIKSNREKIDSKSWHTEVKDQSIPFHKNMFHYVILRIGNTTII